MTKPGSLEVSGWVADYKDPKTAMTVVVEVDGKKAATWVANEYRGDVAQKRPNLGPSHGYDGKVTSPKRNVTVCVTASNGSEEKALGCKKVDAS